MITLRLFHAADPFRQLDARLLREGDLTLGRDPRAQWFIDDADCELSRQHCVVSIKDGRVLVRDLSANGVYLGVERRRIARDVDVEVDARDSIHLGQFIVVIDANALAPANDHAPVDATTAALDAPFHLPMLQGPPLSAEAFAVRSEWACPLEPTPPADPAARPLTDAALLDAFCAGARLDASSFAGEDPIEVMRRAGAIYQQVVLGLGDLMSERTTVKSEFRMDRTTVTAAGNNPFKWAPTQRVAIDLLRARNDGFLSGPAALKASFEDLKKHLLCMVAGSRSAVAAAFDELSPQHIEEHVKGQSLVFVTRSEACWRQFQKRHEDVASEASSKADSAINVAFKKGYEQQLRHLDEIGTRS